MRYATLSRMKELQEYNYSRYVIIAKDFLSRITKQGSGCNVPGYGAAYYSEVDKTLDPIGLVLGFQAIKKSFGTISSEEQRHLVRLLSRKYEVNTETDKAYSEFVSFLQECQDAHDAAFDEYNKVVGSRMDLYNKQMHEILARFTI